jgi:hypothetical protein
MSSILIAVEQKAEGHFDRGGVMEIAGIVWF